MSAPSAASPPPAATSRPFSLTFASKPAPKTSLPAKRPRAALADDDDDQEEAHTVRGPQAVSGFEDGGAVVHGNGSGQKRVKREPLVIPVQRDIEWGRRGGAGKGRGRNLLPAEVQAQQRGESGRVEQERVEEETQYGLVVKRKSSTDGALGENALEDAQIASTAAEARAPPAKTADEEAYDRLVSGDTRTSTLVIPADSDAHNEDGTAGLPTDLRADVASRPEPSSLADYDAVPIEDFGAAMLRGMGWTEGGGVGRARKSAVQPKKLERRANLLGIGAKQVPDGLEELGAWGPKAGPKTRDAYNPLVMRNVTTGEVRVDGVEATGKDERRANGDGFEKGRRERVEDRGERSSKDERRRIDEGGERSSRDERRRPDEGRERSARDDRRRIDEGRERSSRDDRSRRGQESDRRKHRSRSRDRSPRATHSHRGDRERRRDNDHHGERGYRTKSSRY